jgi:threonine dehydrogenase-like Zn-dependent dehydrogenase
MSKKEDESAGKLDVAQLSTQPNYSKTENMKAVTYNGAHLMGGKHVTFGDHPKPLVTHPNDAIIKIELCSISGGDLNMYSGLVPTADDGVILGREAVGSVSETGADVKNFRRGDRVVVSPNLACGECHYCKRKQFSECDATNDSRLFTDMYGGSHGPAAVLGYSRLLGSVPGCQAEYIRIPFADVNLYHVPEDVPSEKAIFASDVLCSGLHAADLGNVNNGDIVAIWGLGPVGLMAGYWCLQKGAQRVIGIDREPERLRLAHKFNIETINRTGLTSEEVVDKLHERLPLARCAGGGVDVAIETAGFRYAQSTMSKVEQTLGMKTESADVLKEVATCARKCGRIVVVGDYFDTVNHFPIGHVMKKQLTVRSGLVPTQKYFSEVMSALRNGKVDPRVLISHRMALQDAPLAYEKLAATEEGYVKVLLQAASP